MGALLIVILLSGESFAVPFQDLDSCLSAESKLDVTQVESSRCETDSAFTPNEA